MQGERECTVLRDACEKFSVGFVCVFEFKDTVQH